MQLVYIVGTYPLVTTTFIEREVRTLRALGEAVRMISIRRPPHEHFANEDGITYLLPPPPSRFVWAHLYFAFYRPRAYFTLLTWLLTRQHANFRQRLKTLLHFGEGVYAAFLVRDVSFEHVHAHFIDRAALVALCVSRLLKKSYSVTAHANDIYTTPVLVREKLENARFVVTVSEFNKQYLADQCPGLDAKKIIVLHPWVDLDEFRPPTSRPVNVRLNIVSVGRLVTKKGHRFLIEACSILNQQGVEFECRIVGDGPLKTELQTMIAANGLEERVKLLGAQPKEIVLAELQRADVFAFPATIAADGDRDGMPVALAEAMAMELPVIATDIVGIRELVRPGTGLLVPHDDAAALAEALRSIQAMTPTARKQMGARGRKVIANDFELVSGVRQLAAQFHSGRPDQDTPMNQGLLYRPRRKSNSMHWFQRKLRGIFR